MGLVKGLPLPPSAAEAGAAALLRVALDEEDSESVRSLSLGRMLRQVFLVRLIRSAAPRHVLHSLAHSL